MGVRWWIVEVPESAQPKEINVLGLCPIKGEGGKSSGYNLIYLDSPSPAVDLVSDALSHVQLPKLNSGCKAGSAISSVGSKIYVIGGSCVSNEGCFASDELEIHNHAEVYSLDKLHPNKGWQSCRPMHFPRNPTVSVVEGRIYAFGGTTDKGACLAEVYDPEKDEWEKLAEIPGLRAESCIFGSVNCVLPDPDGSNNRILLQIDNSLRIYDVHSNSWSCLAEKFHDEFKIFPVSAVHGDFLYCFSDEDGTIHCYDLNNKRWNPMEPEDRFKLQHDTYYKATMFFKGVNKFYFVWYGPDLDLESNPRIGCTSFEFEAGQPLSKSTVTERWNFAFEGKDIHELECFLVL